MRIASKPAPISLSICFIFLFIMPDVVLSQELRLSTDLQSRGKLNDRAYGFTTEFMFNAAAEEVNNQIKLKDNVFPILEEISPNLLRFPSGTVSNFYHYYDQGYGIKKN